MRKLLVLVAAAALVTSSSGCCGCFGKVRSWFQKGSPCGTRVAPAVLGAPMTMAAPAPMMVGAPMQYMQSPMCVPCDPCADPCADPCGGYSTGYMGGMSGCSNCESGSSGMIYEGESYIPSSPSPAMLSPAAPGGRYTDPSPQ
ncbi:MAG: hypothetical protein KF688_04670 [Pirellulales bacterium]|nr:hypothetical protein [Pirellulales bacterium]MBX3432793.1 hypothetical protein [Pirellulales bacterium]